MWPVGKNFWEKKEGSDLLFDGGPHRLDEGQRFASVSPCARFQFLSLHPSLLTRRISPRRIIAWHDYACGSTLFRCATLTSGRLDPSVQLPHPRIINDPDP